jgi:hypothetical protein
MQFSVLDGGKGDFPQMTQMFADFDPGKFCQGWSFVAKRVFGDRNLKWLGNG